MAVQEQEILTQLLDEDLLIPIVLFVCGMVIAVVAIVFGMVTSLGKTRAREATRREIAAYVAEGSITPQEGIEMMKTAGQSSEDGSGRCD